MWRLAFFIGFRFSLTRSKNSLLSFISRLSMASLVLAVSLLICVLSVMNGFERALKEDILSLVPHISLTDTQPVSDWRKRRLEALNHPNTDTVSAFSFQQAVLTKQQSLKPVGIYGVDLDDAALLGGLKKYLGLSDWEKLRHKNPALDQSQSAQPLIIGAGLAKHLQLQVGDITRLLVKPTQASQSHLSTFIVEVTAIIQTGTELDEKLAFASLDTLSLLKNMPKGSVDGLRIQVNDIFSSRATARDIGYKIDMFYMRDWSMTQGNLYQAVQMSKKMVVLISLVIIAVAAFNIVSTLLLGVDEKKSDIAILKTQGLSKNGVLLIFLVQGFVIASIGVLVGLILGVAVSFALPAIGAFIDSQLSSPLLSTSVYPIDYLPSDVRVFDVSMVCLAAFCLSLISTIIPAWVASKSQPADVLKYE